MVCPGDQADAVKQVQLAPDTDSSPDRFQTVGDARRHQQGESPHFHRLYAAGFKPPVQLRHAVGPVFRVIQLQDDTFQNSNGQQADAEEALALVVGINTFYPHHQRGWLFSALVKCRHNTTRTGPCREQVAHGLSLGGKGQADYHNSKQKQLQPENRRLILIGHNFGFQF